MKTITRKGFLGTITAILAAPAMAHRSGGTSAEPDVVRQAELQEVINLWNEMEKRAAGIRARLESGAVLERGKLGVSCVNEESLAWYKENGGIGEATSIDGCQACGLNVSPTGDLAGDIEVLRRHPGCGYVLA